MTDLLIPLHLHFPIYKMGNWYLAPHLTGVFLVLVIWEESDMWKRLVLYKRESYSYS